MKRRLRDRVRDIPVVHLMMSRRTQLHFARKYRIIAIVQILAGALAGALAALAVELLT